MQVASTLWPDIKSQKLSEHRFRLKWTKCSPRTQLRQVKTDRDQCGPDKEAQDSLLDEVGGGWRPWAIGRPPWSADQACGPHHLNQGKWCFPVGSQCRFGVLRLVAPCYKQKGGREQNTHTHTTHIFLSCIPCIVFRLSEVQESSSRRSCSRVQYGFISSSLL